jgi:hypothetical protein
MFLIMLCFYIYIQNHHPGNEWYRRLIRSNRPLYRACPKHTKLLVSKAIVQAVEQQGGRFLERCAGKSGFWYPVPYKRAVDKTSQGLRERDREDGNDGNGNNDGEDEEANTFVPDSFKGNSNATPNLCDLADVAIAHANASRGGQGLQPHSQQMKRPSLGGGKSKSAMKKQAAVPSKRNSKTSISKNATSSVVTAGTTNPNNNRSSWSQMSPPPPPGAIGGSRAAPLPRQPDNANLSSAAAAADEDLVPLPPTLEQRQSSIFRLFQTAKLLPNSSTALNSGLWSQNSPSLASVTNNDSSDGSVPSTSSNNFNNSGGHGTTQQSPQQQSYSPGRLGPNGAMNGNYSFAHPGAPNNIMGAPPGQYATNPAAAAALYEYASQQYPRGGPPPPPYLAAGLSALVAGVNGAQPPYSNSPSLSPPNAGSMNNNGNNGADSAPALTRLTSQVSDWLYSFWPVASSRMESVAGPMSGVSGSPTRNSMGQEKGSQQQQKRPDPLGADADSDEDNGAVQPPSNKRKSMGPYSDMVHNQTQSQAKRASLTNKQEKDNERDARKRFALAPPIVTVPPPRPPGPVHITTIPPLQKGGDRDLSSSSSSAHQSQQHQLQIIDKRRQQQPLHELQQQQQQQYQMQQYQLQQQEQQRRYSQEPPRKRNKRKSSANMPDLPYDHRQLLVSVAPGGNMPAGASSSMNANQGGINGGRGNGSNDDSNADLVAPPTELEQSVSATLLKLAGSPSKHLLSGLTRFFETGETSVGAPLRTAAPGTTESYFLRAIAEATGPQTAMMAAAPSQMMSSLGGGGSFYGAPPTPTTNDFRGNHGGPARGPSLYGNKRSEGDLLEDE